MESLKMDFENYKTGVLEGVQDCGLMRNKCDENGYTETEYCRIKAKIETADFALRIGTADTFTKGYSDGFEVEAIKIYAERGIDGKDASAIFSDLFEKYKAEIPQLTINENTNAEIKE